MKVINQKPSVSGGTIYTLSSEHGRIDITIYRDSCYIDWLKSHDLTTQAMKQGIVELRKLFLKKDAITKEASECLINYLKGQTNEKG